MSTIDAASRRRLLELARVAITAHAQGHPSASASVDGELGRIAGVFVTIRCGGELRGCIGRIEAEEALGHVVARMAVAASSEDPRFRPVSAHDLIGLAIEISVLGSLEPIDGLSDIRVGRDGLIVEQRRQRGLLLPQVAVEHGWDAGVFVAETCVKAGLPRDAWRTGAQVWRFEADVFGD